MIPQAKLHVFNIPQLNGFNSLHAGKFLFGFCRLLIFSNSSFSKILSGIPSEFQKVLIQIRVHTVLQRLTADDIIKPRVK